MAVVTRGVRCSNTVTVLLCEMVAWGPWVAAREHLTQHQMSTKDSRGGTQGHSPSVTDFCARPGGHSPGQVEGVVDNLCSVDDRDGLGRETV